MIKKHTLLAVLLICSFYLKAQEKEAKAIPDYTAISKSNAWEVGLHGGHFFTSGNVDFIPGYGVGFHVRRALDYVFSLRADINYGSARGEDPANVRNFSNKYFAGSLQGLVSLNNLKWSMGERKTNFYMFLGLGLNNFTVDFETSGEGNGKVGSGLAIQSETGGGISFRINNRVNLGIEHKIAFVMGERSDLLDGFQTKTLEEDNRSIFRDVLNYTSFRVNFNISSVSQKEEPLYWLNPLEVVFTDLHTLYEFKESLKDEDEDGVFDMYDKDKSTLPGVIVNSKGQTLDSDSDGVPDYLDKEPFSPPGYSVDGYGVAKQPDVLVEASKVMDSKLVRFEQNLPPPPVTMLTDAAIINMTLPTIYYGVNSSGLGGRDLLLLESVANLLKAYPEIKIVVTGHSDKGGKETNNTSISYWRALAVIDFMSSKYGIRRERLVLQYRGNDEALSNGTNDVNRRVQFKVRTNEVDMPAPK